jgi:transposase
MAGAHSRPTRSTGRFGIRRGFSYGEWKKARVHIDYQVVFDDHFYSAPYQLVGEEVWIRATGLTIEIFHNNQRVGSHLRSYHRGRHTTSDEHRSVLHQKHAEWTPERRPPRLAATPRCRRGASTRGAAAAAPR